VLGHAARDSTVLTMSQTDAGSCSRCSDSIMFTLLGDPRKLQQAAMHMACIREVWRYTGCSVAFGRFGATPVTLWLVFRRSGATPAALWYSGGLALHRLLCGLYSDLALHRLLCGVYSGGLALHRLHCGFHLSGLALHRLLCGFHLGGLALHRLL
jgi:hypothetical protein